MKKLISLTLALMLVFSLATVAFAANVDEEEPPAETTYTDMSTVTLTKQYTLTNSGTTSPAETFTFTVPECTSVADGGIVNGAVVTKDTAPTFTNNCWTAISYASGDAGKTENMTKTATLTLPNFQAVGKYTYTFSEVDNNTAGVSYREGTMRLIIDVIQGENNKVRVAHVHAESSTGTKTAIFTNTYSAGSLLVTKNVTGIMGDQQKDFTVKVTFTAPTGDTVREAITYVDGTETKTIAADWAGSQEATITLKHGETVTFTNIPYGVTYTVEENNYTADGYDAASYKFDDSNKKIDSASENVTITNNKGGTPDTGITLDTLPFVLILAVCAGAVVLFVIKRRNSAEF